MLVYIDIQVHCLEIRTGAGSPKKEQEPEAIDPGYARMKEPEQRNDASGQQACHEQSINRHLLIEQAGVLDIAQRLQEQSYTGREQRDHAAECNQGGEGMAR